MDIADSTLNNNQSINQSAKLIVFFGRPALNMLKISAYYTFLENKIFNRYAQSQ
jgi:hypothetical protein